jgi:DnaJ-class molecular chaperone
MGMPVFENPAMHGDAYVRMVLKIPKDLTDAQKKLLKDFQSMRK